MVFPVVGGDGKPTGYEISNSLRFNDDDGAYLQRTAGANTGEDNATLSFWFKLGNIKSDNNGGTIMTEGGTSGNHIIQIYAHKIYIGSSTFNVMFPNLIRDPSAWYHLFIAFDSSQGTNTNRVKAYLNGVLLTDATGFTTYPDQNENLALCVDGNTTRVGSRGNTGASAFDGYLAEFNFLDGTTKAYTDFGETNDNGVWIPKKYTGGSYGDNGFYLEFKQTGTSANASGIGADTSGEGHHFSVSTVVATDITTDTPTNNFATMNPVHVSSYGSAALPTFSEGNLKIGMNSDSSTSSTIAPSKGKWYVEYKQGENTADNGGYPIVGISATLGGTAGDVIGFRTPDSTNYRGQLGTTSVNNAFGSARSANDIFGFYINLDDDILIVHKNGSDYMGSGASSGLNWSGGLTTTNLQTGFYHFYVQNNQDGSPAYTDEVNFGNPPFAISSSNADANGYGSFEYSPTLSGTNYYSLCTKNLAEYG
jgi:hypothetical protein